MRFCRFALAFLVAASALSAQPGKLTLAGCVKPDYGFDAIDCINCEISGRGQPWIVFHNAPAIRGIRNPGPAFGKLQDGDTLVAIDGIAITMRTAAERYANAKVGDTVEFRVRRGGTVVTTNIVTAAGCAFGQKVSWVWSPMTDSVMRRFFTRDSLSRKMPIVWYAKPGIRPKLPLNQTYWLTPGAMRFQLRRDSTTTTPGWIGIGVFRLLKTPDQMRAQDTAGAFGVTPEIAAVAPGSPAEAAGVVVGDTLVAVDGISILTSAGAQRFLNAPVGTALLLTLRRNGQSRVLSVVPKAPPPTPPASTTRD